MKCAYLDVANNAAASQPRNYQRAMVMRPILVELFLRSPFLSIDTDGDADERFRLHHV